MADVLDGTSSTVMVSEILAGDLDNSVYRVGEVCMTGAGPGSVSFGDRRDLGANQLPSRVPLEQQRQQLAGSASHPNDLQHGGHTKLAVPNV